MDEQQFYIEDTLANSIWDNERYSFVFTTGETNLCAITHKEDEPPYSGVGSVYHIVKEDWYYLLRLVATNGKEIHIVDYKIDDIDKSKGTMQLSLSGAEWKFKRID